MGFARRVWLRLTHFRADHQWAADLALYASIAGAAADPEWVWGAQWILTRTL